MFYEYRKRIFGVMGGALLLASGVCTYMYNTPVSKVSRFEHTITAHAEKSAMRMQLAPPLTQYRDALHVGYGESLSYANIFDIYDIAKTVNTRSDLLRRGTVSIPQLGLIQPIYEGSTDKTLSVGVGTLKENQRLGSGNFAVLGHNFKSIEGVSDMYMSTLQPDIVSINLADKLTRSTLEKTWNNQLKDIDVYVRNDDTVYVYRVKRASIVPATETYVASDNRVKVFNPDKKIGLFTLVTPVVEAETISSFNLAVTATFVEKKQMTSTLERYFMVKGM